jgi:integrase
MAKRRANGEGNIRKRSDGRWEGRYIAGHDEYGKPIRKNVVGHSQNDVREKLAQAIKDAQRLDVARADEYTVGEWLELWYELYSKPNVRPQTQDYYRRLMDKIIPVIGDIKLKKLTGRDLQKLYNEMRTNGRVREAQKEKNPGLSDSVVHGMHGLMHNALNQALREHLILWNPADDCIPPKIHKQEMKTLTAEQVGQYLQAADALGLLPMFFLELSTGLRKGELVALQWDDLDVENRLLRVNKQATINRGDGGYTVAPPKTQASVRQVALSQQAVDLLVAEHEKHPDNPNLFPSPRTGEMYHPDSIAGLHKRILERAGLPSVRLHDLRHTFASLALQNGVDIKTVSGMLGHSDAAFTLRTYTHTSMEAQQQAADMMGDLITMSM